MPIMWLRIRPLLTLAAVGAITAGTAGSLTASAGAPDDQAASVQRLFQAGSYEAAIQAVAADRQKGVETPDATFLGAQALLRLEQTDRAAAEFARLQSSTQPAWRLVGESGAALLDRNLSGAVDLARRATEADGDLSWAHYQLGLAASRQSDFATAARALERAIELKPDFAYSHYYAALAQQRQRQLSKSADHFETFLRLAPEAPERQAVLAIMRTLR